VSSKSRAHISIYGALIANVAIAIVKFIAAWFTGSSSMLSEGIHSVVDSGNELLLLLGMRRSQLAPSEMHSFGHGKELYFWSLIVAILIFGLGGGFSFYEGISHLQHPADLRNPVWNYSVLGFAFLFESISFIIALRSFLHAQKVKRSLLRSLHRSRDPGLFVVVYEDGAAITGIIIAFIGVYLTDLTKNPIFDGIASIMIGFLLTAVAVILIMNSHKLLIGVSAPPRIVKGVEELILAEHPDSVITLKSMHLGPEEILMVMKLKFDEKDVCLLAEKTTHLEEKIQRTFPEVTEIYVECV
jgi:cation diffusion facilitator family transporter